METTCTCRGIAQPNSWCWWWGGIVHLGRAQKFPVFGKGWVILKTKEHGTTFMAESVYFQKEAAGIEIRCKTTLEESFFK